MFAKLADQNKDVVLFALTDDGYKSISLNLGQIRELMAQQRAVIEAYKEYYNEMEKRIEDQRKDYNNKLNHKPADDNVKLDLNFITRIFDE